MQFTVSVQGDQQLIAKFGEMPSKVRMALRRKIQMLALMLQRKVQVEHLSGPTGPHTLSVKTGALRRSVFQTVQSTGTGVMGIVGYGADVPYAAIHEFGGSINVPEIIPTKAKALHFVIGGKDVFAKRVAPHTVHMPARAPLRTAFAEMQDEIADGMKEAVQEAMRE